MQRYYNYEKGDKLSNVSFLVLEAGLEPARAKCPQDFKSGVSTNSTTRAGLVCKKKTPPVVTERSRSRAKNGIRTRDLHLGKVMLYQLSYFRILKNAALFPSADANL